MAPSNRVSDDGLVPAALALAALALCGCAVGPDYKRPDVSVPAGFNEQAPPGAWKHAQPSDGVLRGKWWELFGDPQLDALEEKVAVSNQTLKAATGQYLAALDQIRVARAAYFPTLGVGPAVSRIRLSENQPNTLRGTTNFNYNIFALQGQAQWEPDLWGQVRRTVEQARADAQASAADLANVALSLHAELAADYFQLRGLDTQKLLFDTTLASDADELALARLRFSGGVANAVDVTQAETQYRTVKAQRIDVGVARAQFEHAIATLIGVPAESFSLVPSPLEGKLPVVPAGMPSALLERRPDVAAAERRLAAANAQIGIAVAAYYPNITLSAAGGLESGSLARLLQLPSLFWSLGASAFETLFDAGRRHALTDQARDLYEAQAATYRQSLLNAFQEVEDNLAALRILEEEAEAQAAAVDAARQSLALSNKRYKGGVTTYLEVLTAQTIQLSNERAQADVSTRRFTASVQLVRALGGGWTAGQSTTTGGH
ncbi:MAG TPA: efflux transporter outer membrane subunit [Polyangia bacterium]|nr:efflux transporter outer membrane subunit [Polyangia bacterium]